MDMFLNWVLALIEWYHTADTKTVFFEIFVLALLVITVVRSFVKKTVGEGAEEK